MPSLHWFTLDRGTGGGPSLFSYANRTTADFFWNDWLFSVVITIAAFITVLLILSPAYKHQLKTISLVTTSLLIGGAFVLGQAMPWWRTAGPAVIRSSISVHDPTDLDMILSVHVGLTQVNITLAKIKTGNDSITTTISKTTTVKPGVVLPRLLPRDSLQSMSTTEEDEEIGEYNDVHFNEQIDLLPLEGMKQQVYDALERGLPIPILSVLSYLGHQEEGFRWSYDFRRAGYFCQFTLTLTLISWAWMNIFFLIIPFYGTFVMILTGLLALTSNLVYWLLLPEHEMIVHINGTELSFHMGGCYWTVLTAGLVALLTGCILLVVETRNPGTIRFDLELESEMNTAKAERRSIKMIQHHEPIRRKKKSVLQQRISVIDGTAAACVDDTVDPSATADATAVKQDSGISSGAGGGFTTTDTTSVLLSSHDLDQIATLNGSYLKSSVSNLIQSDLVPNIYSYTFRHGRELPSFHESTISLHSQAVPRFLDSIVEESQLQDKLQVIQVHRAADGRSPSPAPLGLLTCWGASAVIESDQSSSQSSSSNSSERDEWQDAIDMGRDDEDHVIELIKSLNQKEMEEEEEGDSFLSTFTTSSAKKPSPRRRPQRALSIGSHRDLVNNS